MRPDEAVCSYSPPAERVVLYCSADYFARHGYVDVWHAHGEAASPGRFDALASEYCLPESKAALLERMASAAFVACANSTWWPGDAPQTATPLTAPADQLNASVAAALAEGSAAREIFERLGESTLPLSAKALFCLCEGSSRYAELTQVYEQTLELATFPFTPVVVFVLFVLPVALCVCLCCPVFVKLTDTSRYYDKDLV